MSHITSAMVVVFQAMITRKKIPERIEGIINAVGLAILFTFMIVILFKDAFMLIF